MMFSKPPISKSKQLPLPPKSKRIKHELDDDNRTYFKKTQKTLFQIDSLEKTSLIPFQIFSIEITVDISQKDILWHRKN